jgi:DNA modification methylase
MAASGLIPAGLTPLAVDISTLHPYPGNAKKHDIAEIRKSLRRNGGQYKPVVVQRSTGYVLAGNGTLEAMLLEGAATVAAVFVDADDETARRINLADNRIQELGGGYDDYALAALLQDLPTLDGTGFDQEFLDELLEGLDPEPATGANPDAVPEPPAIAVTQPGDLWRLGDHRVLCGDATDAAIIQRLLGTDQLACVFTDPPYGMSYQPEGRRAITGDDKRDVDLQAMLHGAFRLAAKHARSDAAWYVWHAEATRDDFTAALRDAGMTVVDTIVWAKPSGGLGNNDYRRSHEPCLYAVREGHKPAWYGDRTETTVWRAAPAMGGARLTAIGQGVLISAGPDAIYVAPHGPKNRRVRHVRLSGDQVAAIETGADDTTSSVWEVGRDHDADHPTQKPTELVVRALRNSTQRGDLVLDQFLGSGATLIGAELAGRRCAGTELDPLYVDVICRRWQEVTGRKPERDGEPVSFL